MPQVAHPAAAVRPAPAGCADLIKRNRLLIQTPRTPSQLDDRKFFDAELKALVDALGTIQLSHGLEAPSYVVSRKIVLNAADFFRRTKLSPALSRHAIDYLTRLPRSMHEKHPALDLVAGAIHLAAKYANDVTRGATRAAPAFSLTVRELNMITNRLLVALEFNATVGEVFPRSAPASS
jgi:hypothetical protein